MPSDSPFSTASLPPVARVLYKSDLALIGSWRCPLSSSWFRNSGPCRNHLFAFPRTAVRILHANGDDVFADPTVVTLYNRGDEYQRLPVSERGDECEWFAVAPEVLFEAVHTRGLPSARKGRPFGITHTRIANGLYLAQRSLVNGLSMCGGIEPLEVDETVLGILGALVTGFADDVDSTPVAAQHVRWANHAREIVAQRFTERLRLGQLAAECQVSPWFLARVFKRVTRTTIHAYQDRLRLHRALELMPDTSDLAAVALDMGYSTHSHFTTAFKRAFGTTPSNFRAHTRRCARVECSNRTHVRRP